MKYLSKSYYLSTGAVLTLVGGLCMWQTYSVISTPVKKVDLDNLRKNVVTQCVNSAREDTAMGLDVSLGGNTKDVIVLSNSITDWSAKIYAASEIASKCDGMKMVSFCFGEECDLDNDPSTKETGMKMVLQYDSKSEKIVAL